MTYSDFNSHTNKLFLNLKLLKVRDIIKYHQLKLVYDFYNNLLPADLSEMFILDRSIHSHETVSHANNLLHIPRIHTVTYGTNSLRYSCPILWNFTFKNGVSTDNIPTNNKQIHQIKHSFHFKRVMKKHFMYEYSIYQEEDLSNQFYVYNISPDAMTMILRRSQGPYYAPFNYRISLIDPLSIRYPSDSTNIEALRVFCNSLLSALRCLRIWSAS